MSGIRGQRQGVGEGQGCVYNVNTVMATDSKGRRGRERRAPSGPVYPLSNDGSSVLLQTENKRLNCTVYRWNKHIIMVRKLRVLLLHHCSYTHKRNEQEDMT